MHTRLFEEARRILNENHRELAVVLVRRQKHFAISIDVVEAVERIPEENIELMSAALAVQGGQSQWRIGKRGKANQTVLLLDDGFIFASGTTDSIPFN
ncbi:MAG: hypothetical protein ABSH48_27070 [Verrucomicrobiota bacterium]